MRQKGIGGIRGTPALALFVGTLSACGSAETPRAGSGAYAAGDRDECGVWSEFRGIIGEESPKIRAEGDEVWLWAGGEEENPGPGNAEWFDFTGASMNPGDLQYGLGKDAIPSVDDPAFVDPDDPALLTLPDSPYRPCDRPESHEEIMVLGHVEEGQPRAYPLAVLDRHEIVNDEVDGGPFTVGWCPLADLGAVFERSYDGEVDEWGVSGYVYRNTFLLYDRATESLWYPLNEEEGFTAVSGPREGEEVPYTLLEPMPLGEWLEEHPDTEVLYADRRWLQRR